MLERGEKMQAVEIDWIDCGKVDALLYANCTLLARNENQFSVAGTKDVIFIPPVWIGKNTNLKNSVIGPYVSVGDGVQITECILLKTASSMLTQHCLLRFFAINYWQVRSNNRAIW